MVIARNARPRSTKLGPTDKRKATAVSESRFAQASSTKKLEKSLARKKQEDKQSSCNDYLLLRGSNEGLKLKSHL